jgi:class 3 adenylate cyclase
VAAAPIASGDDLLGVLYLHRQSGAFDATACESLAVLGTIVAAGLERARRRALERFYPPHVAQALVREMLRRPSEAPAQELESCHGTAFAVTVSNYEGLCERLPARRLARVLSGTYELVHAVVFGAGGTLVHLAYAHALALFGVPRSGGRDALRAAEAALALRDRFAAWSATLDTADRTGLQVALDSGPMLAGVIGPPQHLVYAAIGAPVATAQALALRAPDAAVFLTDRTWSELGREGFSVVAADRAYAAGTGAGAGEVAVYELKAKL